MYRPNSKWTWSFTAVTLIQAAIVLALESYIFARFQIHLEGLPEESQPAADPHIRTTPTFLTLYIFGFVYQLVLVWDALRMRNTIQIIGLVLYNVGLLIYGGVQMDQIRDAILALREEAVLQQDIWDDLRPFLIVIVAVLGLGTILMAVCAWKLYDEFAWTIYKTISADLKMKKRFLQYQIYIALLKFDFFFFLGFTVQFVVIVTQKQSEFYLTIAAIPVTIIILLAAAWFVRKENLVGTIAVLILYFGGAAYFIFKLVRMYSPEREAAYKPARKELTTFAALTLLTLVLTITYAIICATNYNRGLRPYVEKQRVVLEDEKPIGTSNYAQYATEMTPQYGGQYGGKSQPMVPNAGRMEID